jgi:hypothetical protein
VLCVSVAAAAAAAYCCRVSLLLLQKPESCEPAEVDAAAAKRFNGNIADDDRWFKVTAAHMCGLLDDTCLECCFFVLTATLCLSSAPHAFCLPHSTWCLPPLHCLSCHPHRAPPVHVPAVPVPQVTSSCHDCQHQHVFHLCGDPCHNVQRDGSWKSLCNG